MKIVICTGLTFLSFQNQSFFILYWVYQSEIFSPFLIPLLLQGNDAALA